MGISHFDYYGEKDMQFDYTAWLIQYGIFIVIAIGALILAALTRSRFARARYQEMDDSDKLASPSYEKMDSGVKISVDDEDNP